MAHRHISSGKYSPRGTRQPRTEHTKPNTATPKPSAANAAFNKRAARASAPGAVATAGQLVGAGVKLN